MNNPLDNAKTMQRDTIGDMLTQRPDAAIVLARRYRIVRKLGEGGMGSVWLAEDTKLDGRQVAVKMLPVVLVANKRAIQQLKAEAKVAIQLAHPNIATLRAFEDSDEGPFLVMDYIPGHTLEDVLAKNGTLPEAEVQRIFKPIAEAVDYAHSQKVIHRDIKPSNILIRNDGTPFITDFGIARELKDTMTRVTGRSTSGTLPYMSPEQLRGEPPTPAQDIYSLAATMYEALVGRPPFSRGQIEYQIENIPPPALPSSPLTKAIAFGLLKDPASRPQKARALVSRHLCTTAQDTDRRQVEIPANTASRRGRLVWVRWALVALACGLGLLIGGGVADFIKGETQEAQEAWGGFLMGTFMCIFGSTATFLLSSRFSLRALARHILLTTLLVCLGGAIGILIGAVADLHHDARFPVVFLSSVCGYGLALALRHREDIVCFLNNLRSP